MKLSTQILLAFAVIFFLSIIDSVSNYVLSIKVKKKYRVFKQVTGHYTKFSENT